MIIKFFGASLILGWLAWCLVAVGSDVAKRRREK